MCALEQDSASELEPTAQELAAMEQTLGEPDLLYSPHLRYLVDTGKTRGYVTAQEVLETQQAIGEDPSQRDAIYADLFDAGIEILDEMPPAAEEEVEPRPAEDPLQLYLREVRKVPLLTAAQETELARRVARAGLACKALLGEETRQYLEDDCRREVPHRMAAPEREALEAVVRLGEQSMRLLGSDSAMSREELREIVRQGEEGRRQFTEANLRLVIRTARRYVGLGLSLMDLVQEGNVGLLRAVEKYDASRGCRFSTYATWWIRHAILRALTDQSRTIHIPGHVVQVLRRMSRASRHLLQRLGREPEPSELAAEVGISEELALAVISSSKQPLSLDLPSGEDQAQVLADTLPDSGSVGAEAAASGSLLREQLHLALSALTSTERNVVAMRFGLVDGRYHTLEEAGRVLGMSRERVRQTEGKALRKLRHPTLCSRLREYIPS